VTHGLVLGKFLPPHKGHVYLCEVARRMVDRLTIVVGTLAREPIAGEVRHAWMREMFPHDRVVHLTDENPQDPSEHPEFWAIWRASLERVVRDKVDVVFASDAYGSKLAEVLGARFVSVDPARETFPISGTAVRTDPIGQWEYLPRCVRPHFAKRISIVGPESTGKTTLARALAKTLKTAMVPEWARHVLEARQGSLEGLDWMGLVRGQIASEESLARDCNRVLVCDTDPLITTVWADHLLGACPIELKAIADARRYDLTLLTAPDVPWVQDGVRYLPEAGKKFFDDCAQALERANRRWVEVRGSWEERLAIAEKSARNLIAQAT
jgi:HTH-type transcriptional regulator, transcriptional repressor of NAD biosynthesis genes